MDTMGADTGSANGCRVRERAFSQNEASFDMSMWDFQITYVGINRVETNIKKENRLCHHIHNQKLGMHIKK